MTGTGPLDVEIKQHIETLQLENENFHLLGAVNDIGPILAGLDILCLPSKMDGRPFVMMEAMTSGTPLVASNIGAMASLLEHGHNGWLCEPEDYDAFAETILAVVDDDALLASAKIEAIKTAEAEFDILKNVDAIIDPILALKN